MATQTQQPPQQYLIGVDIGGSHIGLGLIEALTNATVASLSVDINGREITTPEIVKAIVQGCHDLVNQAKVPLTDVLAVGMGCPGQVTNNTLIVAANLPKLIKAPLAQLVSEALGSIHAKLINDADAAISAEVWGNPAIYGRYQHVAMVTLGTGVGFGLILNGRIHQGASGLIEGGHMIVHSGADARRCGCGQQGCVETYASAKSTVQRLQECDALDRQRSSSSSSSSSSPQELNGKVAFDRYSMNDFNAVKVIEETGEYLALMVINVCRVVDPEVIIFGGGLSKAGQPLLEVIKKHVTQRTWKLPTDVKLTLALTDNNGVVGAALAAKSDMLGALVARAPVAATAPAPTTSVTTSTTATVSSPTVAVASPATATSGGDGHRRLARRSSPEPKPRSSSSLPLLSPAVVGAFFAVSSSALLALHFSDSAPGSGSGSGNSSDLRRWLVPTMTQGLMLGQVGVGALAVYQRMRDASP